MKALAALLFAAIGAGVVASGSRVDEPPYYTIAVMGDLQAMMSAYRVSGPTATRYAELEDQIDWIIANRDSEAIQAVLFVGDVIQDGISLPPYDTEVAECDFENGSPYTQTAATCFAIGVEATCKSTSGCYWNADPVDNAVCASCELVARAETEWTGFMALYDRLLPGGDTTFGIPTLLACGNHDNVGTENATDTDREPLGCNQRFSTALYDGRENTYGKRRFEHVASYSDSVYGDAHAYIIQLGSQPVLVVSLNCCSLEGTPDAQESWALSIMSTYSSLPAIVLTHHAESVETNIVDVAEASAPNLIAYIGGHDGHRTVSIETVGALSILKAEIDWTSASANDTNGASQDDYIKLIRFYLDETPTSIEVLDRSEVGDARDATSGNYLAKTAFALP